MDLSKTMKEFANRINPTHESRLVDIVGTGGDKIKTINLSEFRPPFLDKVEQWNKFSEFSGGFHSK